MQHGKDRAELQFRACMCIKGTAAVMPQSYIRPWMCCKISYGMRLLILRRELCLDLQLFH